MNFTHTTLYSAQVAKKIIHMTENKFIGRVAIRGQHGKSLRQAKSGKWKRNPKSLKKTNGIFLSIEWRYGKSEFWRENF
jgi:hypothetical protein